MIICLIVIGMVLVGLIIAVIGGIKEKKDWLRGSSVLEFGYGMAAVGIVASFILALVVIFNHVNTDVERQALLDQRASYEVIIESDDKYYASAGFYESVIEFNREINKYQTWGKNPLTSWFWDSARYEGIEPIDLERKK